MFEYITFVPPGPLQYIFTNYKEQFDLNIKTIIVKPSPKDFSIGHKPDLNIRRPKRKFVKQ